MIKTILTISYPHSGSLDIAHHLSHVLNCHVVNNKTKNFDYTSGFIIRDGNQILCDDEKSNFGKLIPYYNRLNWQLLDNCHRVIFVIRHPSAIAQSIDFPLMSNGYSVYSSWDVYIKQYLELAYDNLYADLFHVVKYEDFMLSPTKELLRILRFIGKKEYDIFHNSVPIIPKEYVNIPYNPEIETRFARMLEDLGY